MTRSKPYGGSPSIFTRRRPALKRNTNNDSDSDVSIGAGDISSDNESATKSNKADIKPTTFGPKGAGKEKNAQGSKNNSKNEGSRGFAVIQAEKAEQFRKREEARNKLITSKLPKPKPKPRRVPVDDTKPLATVESKKLNSTAKTSVKREREDGLGDQHSSFSHTSKKNRKSYGKSHQVSNGNTSQKNTPKRTDSTPQKTFKRPAADDIGSSPDKVTKFRKAPDISFSSPTKSATPKFKKPESSSPDSTPKKSFKLAAALNTKDEEWYKKMNVSKSNTSSLSSLSDNEASDQMPPATQIPVFKKIDIGISMDDSLDGPVRFSSSPDIVNDDSLERLFEGSSDEATCPMCKETVSRVFLESYDNGRMNIRSQTAFCKAHKQQTAAEDWKSRGYPEIDWTALATRITAHRRFLLTLLSETPSYYKDLLSDTVKAGQSRTLKQDLNSGFGTEVSAGYFGPRGQRMFSEWIMHAFAPQLRKRAVDDPLVSARGVTGFVQAVMVPELVCKLIEDDLNVDEEEARDVIEDSWELGELLSEEVDDVVERGEDAERRGSIEYID